MDLVKRNHFANWFVQIAPPTETKDVLCHGKERASGAGKLFPATASAAAIDDTVAAVPNAFVMLAPVTA